MANSSTATHRNAVLNEHTNIVHKHKPGNSSLQTECGGTRTVTHDHLQSTSIEQALNKPPVSKCGRCFRGAGGY
jgi:hypothetical protein